MRLFHFLYETSWRTLLTASAAGLASGACNAGLIALISTALMGGSALPGSILIWSFVGLGLAQLITGLSARLLLTRFSEKTIAGLRRSLSRSISATPLRHQERLGSEKLMAVLTEDIHAVSAGLESVPRLVINVAILAGCSLYLAWRYLPAFLLALAFAVVGALLHGFLVRKGMHLFRLARAEQDTLFRHFRALLHGIKELKLHAPRRSAFFTQQLGPTTATLQHRNQDAMGHFFMAYALFEVLLYLIIGLVLFALPVWSAAGPQALSSFVLVSLYLVGPLHTMLNTLPFIGRANVALQKIEETRLHLATFVAEPEGNARPVLPGSWSRLRLQDVTHTYYREKDDAPFVLGPITLTLHPGEILFVTGGNGSGKTTLAKLITGLYEPETGQILLDPMPIDDHNREAYRQQFSAVFADFYLFERLLGLSQPDLADRARAYLVRLELDHKVSLTNGVLSTTELSQGQRKRLALLTAYLEDRPIYVFDEWAADQDQPFKEVFYRCLIPELKARGKAVLVISHDEPYFNLADRILRLDRGKLTCEQELRPAYAAL